MKAWCRQGLPMLMVLLLLVGCGGGDEPASSSDEASQVTATESPSEPDPEPSEPDGEVLTEPVDIAISARLGSDRRLLVEGTSNLPEGARLQVIVERELSGVRWRSRVAVEEGRFTAGPFGSGSGLPDGGYRIRVELEAASVQPPAVRRRIGAEGQHLSGPLVATSPHGLGQVARATQRFLVGREPARHNADDVEVLRVDE